MSEGKCFVTAVQAEQNRLLQEARLASARKAAAAAQAAWREISSEAPDLAAQDPMPPLPGDDVDALEAFAAAAPARTAALRNRIARRDALRLLTSFRPERGEPIPDEPDVADLGDLDRDARRARAARYVEQLDTSMAADIARVQSLAERLVDCPERPRAQRLEETLRDAVRTANRAAVLGRERAAAARQLLASLNGVEGEAAPRLAASLEALAALGEVIPDELRREVDKVRSEGIGRLNDAFVAEVLRDELRKCDYLVPDDAVETAFVHGGSIIVPDGRNGDYAVAFNVSAGGREVEMEVVRNGPPVPQTPLRRAQDRAAKEDFCRRQAEFRKGMAAAGVSSELIRELPVSDSPVAAVGKRVEVSRASSAKRTMAPPGGR
ncbi:MAG TPA: hypothetical protein VIT38_15215 [Allosphingosinicella sp.]